MPPGPYRRGLFVTRTPAFNRPTHPENAPRKPHPNSQPPTWADGLLNSTSLAPSADFWLLVLWKKLVGPRVLGVSGTPSKSTTRAYGFCAPSGASATLVLINLASAPGCAELPVGFAAPGAPLTQYSLTPGAEGVTSATTLLNGAPLVLDAAGRLPQMEGKSVPQTGGVALPPLSVTLLVAPLADSVTACGP